MIPTLLYTSALDILKGARISQNAFTRFIKSLYECRFKETTLISKWFDVDHQLKRHKPHPSIEQN